MGKRKLCHEIHVIFLVFLFIPLFFLPDVDVIAQTCQVSGHIRTSSGQAIEGVTISPYTVKTDANGYYSLSFSNLFGTFLAPKKENWTFEPKSRGYSGTGTFTNQDYTGTATGSTVNVITFDEARYRSVSGQVLYRGGPNTLIDTEFDLNFFVAFGKMYITPFSGDYMLYFDPHTDPRGRIVITFDNLQQYVRIKLGTDGTPVTTPAYLRVSYYRDSNPSNPLYSKDGGGTIEYTNTTTGIKMLIVDTHYAENDIFELAFSALGGQTEPLPSPVSPIALGGYSAVVPLAWIAPTSKTPQSYNIYRSTTSGSGYQKIASNIQRLYYLDKVSSNNTYYYRITAIFSTGESAYSVERSAQTQSQGNVCRSSWIASPPVIDGLIKTNEWQNATRTNISYPGGSGEVTLYAMNTSTALYLAVDDPRDKSRDNGDNFSLFIDSDNNREWPSPKTGHDGMLRFVWNDNATVTYRSMYGLWPNDLSGSDWITPSGTQQAISTASGHIQYEVKIDLNADILHTTPKSTIGLCCFVYDNGGSKFDALKPFETEYLSPLVQGYLWSYGPFAYMDFSLSSATGINDSPKVLPSKFRLSQNYPNPFNPSTRFEFQLATPGRVTLKIYDLLGKEVATVLNEELQTGSYQYLWDAGKLASGVYMYRLTAGSYRAAKKMILLE